MARLPRPEGRGLRSGLVSNEFGGTGQSQLVYFKPWAKYFDCFILDLKMDESAAILDRSRT